MVQDNKLNQQQRSSAFIHIYRGITKLICNIVYNLEN